MHQKLKPKNLIRQYSGLFTRSGCTENFALWLYFEIIPKFRSLHNDKKCTGHQMKNLIRQYSDIGRTLHDLNAQQTLPPPKLPSCEVAYNTQGFSVFIIRPRGILSVSIEARGRQIPGRTWCCPESKSLRAGSKGMSCHQFVEINELDKLSFGVRKLCWLNFVKKNHGGWLQVVLLLTFGQKAMRGAVDLGLISV